MFDIYNIIENNTITKIDDNKSLSILITYNAFCESVNDAVDRLNSFYKVNININDFVNSFTQSGLEGAMLLNPDKLTVNELIEFEKAFSNKENIDVFINELIKQCMYEVLYCYALYKSYSNYKDIDILLLTIE